MSNFNRMGNAKNPYQGDAKRVLCVCSAGLLRSPTMAFVLSSSPFNYNTRAAGISDDYALIPVDKVLIYWADEIVVAENYMYQIIEDMFTDFEKPIISLNLPDTYAYRDPELIRLIKERYKKQVETV